MTNQKLRVRFAPSPTGFLHVGSLRTALYNYLTAKKHGGDFILRIEDTDQTRYVEGAVERLIFVLNKIGLAYDEGPYLENGVVKEKGNFGPYFQSKRTEIYRKYAAELIKKDRGYYCFCSAERLEDSRRKQEINHESTMYDGLCRDLSKEKIENNLKREMPYVIRLKMPKEGIIKFKDLIRGEVEFENKLIDDQVLIKSDGFPTYHLANVVDDHLMKIALVIRGEEWLSSTPKHIFMYQAFGWEAPQFAHTSLLLNPDKSKLSKRQGDVAVEDFLKMGYLPEALLNFMAFLGWNPGTEEEIFTLSELIETFDISKVQKAGAIFNLVKLNWLNAEYLKRKKLDDLLILAMPYLKEAGINLEKMEQTKIKAILSLARERLEKLSDLPKAVRYFFEKPNYEKELLIWKKSDMATTKKRIETLVSFYDTYNKTWIKEGIEKETLELIQKENLDNGATLWPLRAALSGREKSPGPFEIAAILGREETIKRLKIAENLLN